MSDDVPMIGPIAREAQYVYVVMAGHLVGRITSGRRGVLSNERELAAGYGAALTRCVGR